VSGPGRLSFPSRRPRPFYRRLCSLPTSASAAGTLTALFTHSAANVSLHWSDSIASGHTSTLGHLGFSIVGAAGAASSLAVSLFHLFLLRPIGCCNRCVVEASQDQAAIYSDMGLSSPATAAYSDVGLSRSQPPAAALARDPAFPPGLLGLPRLARPTMARRGRSVRLARHTKDLLLLPPFTMNHQSPHTIPLSNNHQHYSILSSALGPRYLPILPLLCLFAPPLPWDPWPFSH
jgi:hypothetical protein